MTNRTTFVVLSDRDGKLNAAAKLACNMWNCFIEPEYNTVVRLGTFTRNLSPTTARAFKPWVENGIRYGRVEFNTKFLNSWGIMKTAGTIAHEIGHTHGFGWDRWMDIVNTRTGRFTRDAVSKIPALENMRIELQGKKGVRWSHWDEGLFDRALMTPYKDNPAHVLPVTFEVMTLLGHSQHKTLSSQTPLDTLLQLEPDPPIDWDKELEGIDLMYFEETEIIETLPHGDKNDKDN